MSDYSGNIDPMRIATLGIGYDPIFMSCIGILGTVIEVTVEERHRGGTNAGAFAGYVPLTKYFVITVKVKRNGEEWSTYYETDSELHAKSVENVALTFAKITNTLETATVKLKKFKLNTLNPSVVLKRIRKL